MRRRPTFSLARLDRLGSPPPSVMAKVLRPKMTPELEAFMERRHLTIEDILSRAWGAFKLCLIISLPLDLFLILALHWQGLAYAIAASLGLPLLIASWIANLPKAECLAEETNILRESPSVVGMMIMSMHLRPSLEVAIAFASSQPGTLQGRLREAAWRALTKASEGMETSLLELTASLSDANDCVRQAFHLLLAAMHESGREGLQRLLDRANAVVLQGVRDSTELYVSSLSTPTMVLFAVGILVPVLLFSMMPLQAIGGASSVQGSTGSAAIPVAEMAALLLVILPLFAFAYSRSILVKNPIGQRAERPEMVKVDLLAGGTWAASLLVLLILFPLEEHPYEMLFILGIPPALYLVWRSSASHRTTLKDRGAEIDLISALFQVGNRMAGGTSFEKALEQTASSRGDGFFESRARVLLHRTRVSRMAVDMALAEDDVFRSRFPLIWSGFLTVAESSSRDARAAGKVALSLASNLDDIRKCRTKTDETLRSTVEMMQATSTYFAPIILGVTASLFSLTENISVLGLQQTGVLTALTGAYILELVLLITYFTTFLRGDGRWDEMFYRFGTRAPVALALFTLVSLFSRVTMTQLL